MRILLDAVARHAVERPAKTAVVGPDGASASYRELLERSRLVAASLGAADERGVVAIALPSGPDLWAAVVGTAMTGRTPALLPHPAPGLLARRLSVELAGASMLDTTWIERVRRGELMQALPIDAGRVEPGGLILLSSGTTGHSRFIRRGAAAIDRIARTLLAENLCIESDRVASFLPMSHAYGFEHALLAPIVAGATVHALGEFTNHTAAEAMSGGATSLPIVPIMARALADNAPFRADMAHAPSSLRSVVVAGAMLHPTTRRLFESAHGLPLVDLYGASELGTIWLDRGDGGRPVEGVEIDIRPTTSGDRHDGEICVRSACMYEASYDREGRPEPAPADGWFRTGDLGARASDGTLRVTGRLKLVFDVGGLKVNPVEVEHALELHPRVRRALVYPLRANTELWRVGASIEPRPAMPGRDAAPPTLSELREHLAPLLPSHALPRSLTVTSQLPQTPSGKLLRDHAPSEPNGVASSDGIAPVTRRPKGLEQQQARESYTKQLFDETAKGYDHSSGAAFLRSGRWYRRRMLIKAGLKEGSSHLDVGSGTGLCAFLGQQIVGPTGRVVALDPSTGMLEVARRRGVRETIEGRAEKLPFPDATFDVVSMSYMLRHIEDLVRAFGEARRVLRPGGRIVIFELTRPESRLARSAFDLAMWWVVPGIGVIASGRPSTFPMMRYWTETIEAAARPPRIVEALDRAGFVGTRHLLELGVFSCYRGTAPRAS